MTFNVINHIMCLFKNIGNGIGNTCPGMYFCIELIQKSAVWHSNDIKVQIIKDLYLNVV